MEAILMGFEDYTVDQRGDVGSWVRLASLKAIRSCLPSQIEFQKTTQSLVDRCISCALKQLVERLDNVREMAAAALVTIIDSTPRPGTGAICVQYADEIRTELRKEENWRDRAHITSRVLELLSASVYRMSILQGAVSTVVSSHVLSCLRFCNSDLELLT